MAQKKVSKVTQSPWNRGFLGAGHQAKAILDGVRYQESDPFIVFMDDNLDLPGGEPVGGPHPHAGIETLTLVLEGNDADWKTGNFELMTAGSGIIHTEEITSKQTLRVLQVWLVLPPDLRWAGPAWQELQLEDVPVVKTDDKEIRVYSGQSNGLTSPLKNLAPFTLVDFHLRNQATATQEIPSHYNGLVYVLNGGVNVSGQVVKAGQVGWLRADDVAGTSQIEFVALDSNTRFVLYAGQPHHAPVVQHGPFVAGNMEEIAGLYRDFRRGLFPHLSELPARQKAVIS